MTLSAIPLAVLTVLGVISFNVLPVSGHGRFMVPLSRSSLWRDKNFKAQGAVTNTQDNELFCGGFDYQVRQGYKCGVCGDKYDGTKDNEAGGKYGLGIISKTYTQGDDAVFEVDLTANHKGFFEFKICPTNSKTKKATKECLDKRTLKLVGKPGTQYPITTHRTGMYKITVELPSDLTCSQCVVQWRYHAGNSWGVDPDGRGCIGCGPQEEFYGCADIEITSRNGPPKTKIRTPAPPTSKPKEASKAPYVPHDGGPKSCESVGAFAKKKGIKHWCLTNCTKNNCPRHMCKCIF